MLYIDLQYFNPINLIKIAYNHSDIIFDATDPHQRLSFRNRTIIAGADGIITLSIPLIEGRDQKSQLKDVRISNRNKWQPQHFKTICSCYNRSPFFEYYRDDLEVLYSGYYEFLYQFNLVCFDWVMKQFGWLGVRHFAESGLYEASDVEATDLRKWVNPRNYADFEGPAYHQVFESKIGFRQNLSILDYLFCAGNKF
jgi:hypothetical protein